MRLSFRQSFLWLAFYLVLAWLLSKALTTTQMGSSSSGLYLNEFMPRPVSDWNGDDEVGTSDEYIELINLSGQPFSLVGLRLDDIEGGSPAYTLTGTLQIAEIGLFFRSETGIALNDTGDEVRLLAASGAILDFASYTGASQDEAFSRDEAGEWHDDWLPSPGEPNQIILTATPTLTEPPTLKKAFLHFEPRHAADTPASWADISKAEHLLGWRPEYSFEKGVEALVEWYRENRAWAKEIATMER